jgi:hypothetical protein
MYKAPGTRLENLMVLLAIYNNHLYCVYHGLPDCFRAGKYRRIGRVLKFTVLVVYSTIREQ